MVDAPRKPDRFFSNCGVMKAAAGADASQTRSGGVFVHEVFVEEYGDQHCGGDGD